MAQETNKLKSDLAVRTYDHDPADATVATKVNWVAMTEAFMALLTVIVGAVVTFKIFAATDDQGAGATVVKAHATPTTADAEGDQLVLEVSAEEVKAALEGATHVSVEVDMVTNTDQAAVTYVRRGFRHGQADQTADVIA